MELQANRCQHVFSLEESVPLKPLPGEILAVLTGHYYQKLFSPYTSNLQCTWYKPQDKTCNARPNMTEHRGFFWGLCF
ncbi:hypothetical protein ACOSP7_005196 [Xanthoceras sorbifolium]